MLGLGIIALFLGCSRSPAQVYKAMEEAAQKGNYREFVSYFDSKSRPFVQALLELQKSAYPAGTPPKGPLALLTTCDVIGEEKAESGNRYLELDCENGTRYLGFVKEDGKWRVDIALTQRLNQRKGGD